jgi:hypothetical protein
MYSCSGLGFRRETILRKRSHVHFIKSVEVDPKPILYLHTHHLLLHLIMRPTSSLLGASRLPLTTKRANKDFYKGTRLPL